MKRGHQVHISLLAHEQQLYHIIALKVHCAVENAHLRVVRQDIRVSLRIEQQERDDLHSAMVDGEVQESFAT